MTKARDIARAGTALTNVDATELGYLDGVTSAVQTQLNQKPEFTAGKNKIINGDFGIWQRGTSFTFNTAGGYSADRWLSDSNGVGTVVLSRQNFALGSAPVSGYESQHFIRINRTVLSGPTDLVQRIEDVRTFAGQTVTLSFWAKADTTRTLNIFFYQYFGSGGSADAASNTVNIDVGTSWARYTATLNVPSLAGKTIGTGPWAGIYLRGPNLLCTIDYWGVQLEAGSVATPFTLAGGGSQQAELALCQRYYWQDSGFQQASGNQSTFNNILYFPINVFNAVPMRITPTATFASTPYVQDWQQNLRTITAVSTGKNWIGFTYDSTKLSNNSTYGINFADAGRSLTLSSEL